MSTKKIPIRNSYKAKRAAWLVQESYGAARMALNDLIEAGDWDENVQMNAITVEAIRALEKALSRMRSLGAKEETCVNARG